MKCKLGVDIFIATTANYVYFLILNVNIITFGHYSK